MAMRARSRKAPSASDAATIGSAPLRLISRDQRRRRFFQLAALGEDFDPAFSLFEPRVTEAGQLNTALVQRERLLEGQIALFELLDDRFELRDRGFEVLDRRIGHLAVPSSSQGPRRYKEKG